MEITSFKLENKHKKTTRGRQDGFYLQEDLLLGYFQGQVAQMVAKQKQTKTLRFQNENTKEETLHAQGGSRGGYMVNSKGQFIIYTSRDHLVR